MSNQLQIVGFRVGAETFGIAIESVHEIVRMPQITQIPEAPAHVEGVINLRGRIIPVIDLRKRFGERQITANKKNRIVVAEVSGKMAGLIVDSANEVLKIAASEVEPPPNVFEEGDVQYVTGIGRWRERLIILVDLDKVLQRGELRRLGRHCLTGDSDGNLVK
jgi:purine-binding chemotaxis protein CheW